MVHGDGLPECHVPVPEQAPLALAVYVGLFVLGDSVMIARPQVVALAALDTPPLPDILTHHRSLPPLPIIIAPVIIIVIIAGEQIHFALSRSAAVRTSHTVTGQFV